MALLLPLSQNVSSQIGSALDLQRAIFQASTFTHLSEFAGTLSAVSGFLSPHRTDLETYVSSKGTTYRKEMRYFDFLGGDNEAGSRLALSEIAMHPKAINLLYRQSPDVTRRLVETALQAKVDATNIQEGHLSWIAGPLGGHQDSPLSAWGSAMYWMSGIASPKNWLAWISGASLAPELAVWAATGHAPSAFMAASTSLLAGALYGSAHRNSANRRLIEAAKQGPLDYEAIRQFFGSFNRALPTNEPIRLANDNGDVIQSLRKSSAQGGVPRLSLGATARVIADFLSLGSVTVDGLKANLPKEVYNRLAQSIGLGTLANTHWQPSVLNAERLERIAEYRSRGKKVIFVGNHRSHLDILLAVALLRDCDIRFVAKSSLLKVPVLKDILRLANHCTVDRDHDDERLEKVVAWGASMFEQGLSPFFFIEGTRMDTPNRREEVGMRPPEIGAATLAARFPDDVVIVPIVNYGFGALLRKEGEKGSVKEGSMEYQPTLTSILEPIEASRFLDKDPSLSDKEEVRLNSHLWNLMWDELSRIQAYMNDLAVKAARAA